MKKSLIAVAVAGLFAAPAAMAEVTLSGAINLGIEIARSSSVSANPFFGTSAVDGLTRTLLNSNYSHVDLESVDDIGGGNKVIFHYQMQANPQTTGPNGGPFNRNSFLGIAGGWGAFKMGTNENVYERMMYTADPLDGALGPGGNLMILGTPGFGTAFDAGQSGCGPASSGFGCIGFYRRTDQTIWYESPDFAGFTFEIDQTLSAFKQNDSTSPTGQGYDPKVLSIGGKFQPAGGPFYVDLAYERHDDMFALNAINGPGTATSSKDTGLQVGGGLTFGDLGLHARYEQLKYKADGVVGGVSEYKRDAYWFGVKYNLPSGYVGGEFGVARDGKADGTKVDNTGAKMFGIGYFHNLSKQSQLQFIYGRTDNNENATYTQAGAPLGGLPGSDHQVIHVGLKHTY
jgi:predicted porin